MKTHISSAIVMRVKEFGESDLLATFFTSEMGVLKGVAKGGRRSRRRFANCLDLFSLVHLEYGLRKEGADLYFLHSGKLIDAFEGLRANFTTLSLASSLIEMTEALFPPMVADESMFRLLRESLAALSRGKEINLVPVLFELKAMALGGFGISVDHCCFCGRTYAGRGTAVFVAKKGGISCLKCGQVSTASPLMGPTSVQAVSRILSTPLERLQSLTLSAEVLDEIKVALRLHRERCLGKELKTSKYLD